MKKQFISIHLGQAGIQIGNAIWQLLCGEHNIDPTGHMRSDGLYDDSSECRDVLFHHTSQEVYSPLAMMFDLEPTVIDELRTGSYSQLWNPNFLVHGKEDAANNFARGYYTIGNSYIEPVMEKMGKLFENCDYVDCAQIVHGISGGTGSGFASLLLEYMSEEYPKTYKLSTSIFPSHNRCTSVLDSYNALLHFPSTLADVDCQIMVDNESLQQLINDHLHIEDPTYYHMNRIIAPIISSISMTNRFHFKGDRSMQSSELLTNLIPYPRIHYKSVSAAPLLMKCDLESTKLTTKMILSALFDKKNQMVCMDSEYQAYISCGILLRGNVNLLDVSKSTSFYRKCSESTRFVDWCPTGFKLGINHLPNMAPFGDDVIPRRSAIMISGNLGVKKSFWNITNKFDKLYGKHAFVHWFVGEGLEEAEFIECREDICHLITDYEEIEKEMLILQKTEDKKKHDKPIVKQRQSIKTMKSKSETNKYNSAVNVKQKVPKELESMLNVKIDNSLKNSSYQIDMQDPSVKTNILTPVKNKVTIKDDMDSQRVLEGDLPNNEEDKLLTEQFENPERRSSLHSNERLEGKPSLDRRESLEKRPLLEREESQERKFPVDTTEILETRPSLDEKGIVERPSLDRIESLERRPSLNNKETVERRPSLDEKEILERPSLDRRDSLGRRSLISGGLGGERRRSLERRTSLERRQVFESEERRLSSILRNSNLPLGYRSSDLFTSPDMDLVTPRTSSEMEFRRTLSDNRVSVMSNRIMIPTRKMFTIREPENRQNRPSLYGRRLPKKIKKKKRKPKTTSLNSFNKHNSSVNTNRVKKNSFDDSLDQTVKEDATYVIADSNNNNDCRFPFRPCTTDQMVIDGLRRKRKRQASFSDDSNRTYACHPSIVSMDASQVFFENFDDCKHEKLQKKWKPLSKQPPDCYSFGYNGASSTGYEAGNHGTLLKPRKPRKTIVPQSTKRDRFPSKTTCKIERIFAVDIPPGDDFHIETRATVDSDVKEYPKTEIYYRNYLNDSEKHNLLSLQNIDSFNSSSTLKPEVLSSDSQNELSDTILFQSRTYIEMIHDDTSIQKLKAPAISSLPIPNDDGIDNFGGGNRCPTISPRKGAYPLAELKMPPNIFPAPDFDINFSNTAGKDEEGEQTHSSSVPTPTPRLSCIRNRPDATVSIAHESLHNAIDNLQTLIAPMNESSRTAQRHRGEMLSNTLSVLKSEYSKIAQDASGNLKRLEKRLNICNQSEQHIDGNEIPMENGKHYSHVDRNISEIQVLYRPPKSSSVYRQSNSILGEQTFEIHDRCYRRQSKRERWSQRSQLQDLRGEANDHETFAEVLDVHVTTQSECATFVNMKCIDNQEKTVEEISIDHTHLLHNEVVKTQNERSENTRNSVKRAPLECSNDNSTDDSLSDNFFSDSACDSNQEEIVETKSMQSTRRIVFKTLRRKRKQFCRRTTTRGRRNLLKIHKPYNLWSSSDDHSKSSGDHTLSDCCNLTSQVFDDENCHRDEHCHEKEKQNSKKIQERSSCKETENVSHSHAAVNNVNKSKLLKNKNIEIKEKDRKGSQIKNKCKSDEPIVEGNSSLQSMYQGEELYRIWKDLHDQKTLISMRRRQQLMKENIEKNNEHETKYKSKRFFLETVLEKGNHFDKNRIDSKLFLNYNEKTENLSNFLWDLISKNQANSETHIMLAKKFISVIDSSNYQIPSLVSSTESNDLKSKDPKTMSVIKSTRENENLNEDSKSKKVGLRINSHVIADSKKEISSFRRKDDKEKTVNRYNSKVKQQVQVKPSRQSFLKTKTNPMHGKTKVKQNISKNPKNQQITRNESYQYVIMPSENEFSMYERFTSQGKNSKLSFKMQRDSLAKLRHSLDNSSSTTSSKMTRKDPCKSFK